MSAQSPSPQNTAPVNVLSIVGFVLSLLGFNVVAIILGAIGLRQIKKSGERGRGFALAAVWIGVIWIVIIVVWVVVVVVAAVAQQTGAA